METYHDICDREGWPSGPWEGEPDRAEWVHDALGVRCTMRRGPLGSWCGYVGVGENHPAFFKNYQDIEGADVHGGITYGDKCEPIYEDEWIRYRLHREKWITESLIYPQGDAARHLREDRKGDTSTLKGFQEWMRMRVLCHADCRHHLMWFGFDCAHAFDRVPGLEAARIAIGTYRPMPSIEGFTEVYRDFAYVMDEVNKLAVELFKIEVPPGRRH